MPGLLRSLLLVTLALAVPIVPLLILGLSFEEQVAEWLNVDRHPALNFSLIVLALASDLFLPVPSSAVSTYAGGSGLGFWTATAASWLGMTAGAVIGFSLARIFGEHFTRRRASEGDLEKMAALTRRYGPLALVITRALPILAEACVLLMGATGLTWRRFLPPVIVANLVISLVYAAFGVYFEGSDALPWAVVASGTVPLLIALLARRWLPGLELLEETTKSAQD